MSWKTWFGRCLYQDSSGIKIFDNFFFRWLRFESKAIQTLIYKKRPHYPCLNYLKPFTFMVALEPGDCCMLGLGGGAIVHLLAPFLHSFHFTVVEKSLALIELAHRYFYLNPQKINLVAQNALAYLQETDKKFDYLLVDLFNEHNFPAECKTVLFFNHCQNLLRENGLMILNIANTKELASLTTLIDQGFQHRLIIPAKNKTNLIVLAMNCPNKTAFLDRLRKHKIFKKLTWDSQLGFVGELY